MAISPTSSLFQALSGVFGLTKSASNPYQGAEQQVAEAANESKEYEGFIGDLSAPPPDGPVRRGTLVNILV